MRGGLRVTPLFLFGLDVVYVGDDDLVSASAGVAGLKGLQEFLEAGFA